MRLATKVRVTCPEEPAKTFTAEEFRRVMRSANLVGAFAFWCALESLAESDERTRFHARGVLRAMAESQFINCKGVAFSEQHAEAFRYCGLVPLAVHSRC